MAGALSDLVILDFTRVVAGPTCTMYLAELGAEVIKVEMRENGDSVRQIPPFTEGGEAHIFALLNRGKKSITLDVTKEEGRKIALELMAKADIVVENFSPGTLEKLGLGYDSAVKVKPDIIFAAISGFGQTGPYAERVSFDIVAQAMGGLMSTTGFPDAPPTKVGAAIGDQGGAFYCLAGILAALHYRNKTGQGQYIDISLQDAVFMMTGIESLPYYMNKKILPKRWGNAHEVLIPWNLYKTKDGHIIIGCVNNGQWQRLAELIGRADMVPTAETTTLVYRNQHRDEIDKAVTAWTSKFTTAEAEKMLHEANLAASPVLDLAQCVADPQLKSRDMIVEIDQTISGKIPVTGTVFKMSKTPGNPLKPADFLGEHNTAIYGELLGYSEEKIKELMDKKVI
ncbi:MAG: CaiB/BaiF CoA transferase family protein [Smithellaceae bacterium]